MASEQKKTMNIFEKLSAITAEISAVAKNLEVGFGQNKYKAVGEADVLVAVKPIERKYGVYSYPVRRDIVDSGILENIDSKGNVKKQLYLRIKTLYRFVNVEEPMDCIETEVYSDGVDPQDKAPGKAMTYGDKYALLKAYKIITGEDPDQYASEPLKSVGVVHEDALNADAYSYYQQSREEIEDAQKSAEIAKQRIGEDRARTLYIELVNNGADPAKVLAMYKGVERLGDLTESQHLNIIQNMKRVVEKCPLDKTEVVE